MFCLKKCGAKIGKNSRIGCNAFILNFENLSLGDNSSIEKIVKFLIMIYSLLEAM